MANTPHLPRDIIEIILSKLVSVKALLRFKSVSKSWNFMITDPLFIKYHHQQQSKLSQYLFVRHVPISGEFTLVKLEDQRLETVQVLRSPYNCEYALCRYESVLLLTDFSRIQVLWNPSTRTHKQIAIPFQRLFESSCGLCPDPTNDGFKVVIVDNDNYSVYSIENKSFIIDRKKSYGLYTYYGRSICNPKLVCVDGAVYWASSGCLPEIFYFDPSDDNFKVLQKPEYIIKKGKFMYLADLGGSLCVYCEGEGETRIKMWIKEKGIDNHSWKDLITIENVDEKMGIWSFEPQCMVGNKIVGRDRLHNHLVAYSTLEKTFEQFADTELNGSGSLRDLVPYLDYPIINRCSGSDHFKSFGWTNPWRTRPHSTLHT